MCWERLDKDGRFRRSDAIKNRFVRLYRKAGLERPYGRGFYSLRHMFATVIGINSHDLREVQSVLGHKNIRMQFYYRNDRAEKAAAAQKHIHAAFEQTSIPKIIADSYSRLSKHFYTLKSF